MAKIGFIGLGRLGLPMATNLLSVGHNVTGFDLNPRQTGALQAAGGCAGRSASEAIDGADFIITRLPDHAAVRSVWMEDDHALKAVSKRAIVIDCSLIGIEESRTLATFLETSGLSVLDAPVLGEPSDAEARMLGFVVGGGVAAFMEAKPILEDMGDRVTHAGKTGMGQAAALCVQLMTVANLLGAAEAFALAERLGLQTEKLFEVAALSSASSWVLAERCPQPGLVPHAPSSNGYQGGVSARNVLSALRLLEQSAKRLEGRTPLTVAAVDLLAEFCDVSDPKLDFSAIIGSFRRH